jgi:hypothetical protein
VGVVALGVRAVGPVGEKWGNRRTGKWAWSHCGRSHCAPSAAWAWSHCGSSHSALRHCGCSDSQPPQSARSHSPLPPERTCGSASGSRTGKRNLDICHSSQSGCDQTQRGCDPSRAVRRVARPPCERSQDRGLT